MDKQHQKDKLHFQIERIAFFSDAVIAIAATLLIIEIKAPHIETGTGFSEQINQLRHLIPEFISFIISFSIIIAQWVKHHELFGNIIYYDKKLIALNSFFLFAIAIIPFSTSYFAHNSSVEFYLPYIVYGLSLFLLTFLNYLLFRHITNEKNKLFDNSLTKVQLKWIGFDYLLFPTGIIAGLLMGIINFKIGFITYMLIMTFGFYINRQKKKYSH
jgi:uncharacterized membrane protein